jgi:hypothetical protein
MEIEINIGKRNFIFFVVLALFFVFLVFVVAQTPNPGHSVNEISGVCRTDGDRCLGCNQRDTNILYYNSASTWCQEAVLCATTGVGYIDNFVFNAGNWIYNSQTNPENCQSVLCGDV